MATTTKDGTIQIAVIFSLRLIRIITLRTHVLTILPLATILFSPKPQDWAICITATSHDTQFASHSGKRGFTFFAFSGSMTELRLDEGEEKKTELHGVEDHIERAFCFYLHGCAGARSAPRPKGASTVWSSRMRMSVYCFSVASVWRRVPQGTELWGGGCGGVWGGGKGGGLIPKSFTRHRTVRQCIDHLLYIE